MAKITSQTKTDQPFVRNLVQSKNVTVDDTALDAGHTGNTHILRAGLELGIITSSGKYVEYDEAGTDDGRRVCHAILLHDVDLKDGDPGASASDQPALVMLQGTAVAAECIGHDANAVTDLAKGGGGTGLIYFV